MTLVIIINLVFREVISCVPQKKINICGIVNLLYPPKIECGFCFKKINWMPALKLILYFQTLKR